MFAVKFRSSDNQNGFIVVSTHLNQIKTPRSSLFGNCSLGLKPGQNLDDLRSEMRFDISLSFFNENWIFEFLQSNGESSSPIH